MRREYNVTVQNGTAQFFCKMCASYLPADSFYPSDRRAGKTFCKPCHLQSAREKCRRPYHRAAQYLKRELWEHYQFIVAHNCQGVWDYGPAGGSSVPFAHRACAPSQQAGDAGVPKLVVEPETPTGGGPGPAHHAPELLAGSPQLPAGAGYTNLRHWAQAIQPDQLAAIAENAWQGRSAFSGAPVTPKDARFIWWDRGRLPMPGCQAPQTGPVSEPLNLVMVTRREFIRYRRMQKKNRCHSAAEKPLCRKAAMERIVGVCGPRNQCFYEGLSDRSAHTGETKPGLSKSD